MLNIRRAMRNLVRRPVRAILISLLVAVAFALAIMSMSLNNALEIQLDSMAAEMGTQFEVRPAGSFGGMGMGEPLKTRRAAAAEYKAQKNRVYLPGLQPNTDADCSGECGVGTGASPASRYQKPGTSLHGTSRVS